MGVSLGTANTPLHFSHHGRIAVECLFISASAVGHGDWATEVFMLAKKWHRHLEIGFFGFFCRFLFPLPRELRVALQRGGLPPRLAPFFYSL